MCVVLVFLKISKVRVDLTVLSMGVSGSTGCRVCNGSSGSDDSNVSDSQWL